MYILSLSKTTYVVAFYSNLFRTLFQFIIFYYNIFNFVLYKMILLDLFFLIHCLNASLRFDENIFIAIY